MSKILRRSLLISCLFLTCEPQEDIADAAPIYTQKGPHNKVRPTFSSSGVEFYNATTGTFQAVSLSDAVALVSDGGALVIKPERRLSAVQNSLTLTVYPLGLVPIKTGTSWAIYTHTSTSTFDVSVASASCPACSSVTTTERYYVYAYNSSGLKFEVSTTAPDSGLWFKTGDSTRTYVGTFRTNTAGNIQGFVSTNGVYNYVLNLAVLSAGNATTSTALSLYGTTPFADGSKAVPPHARKVTFGYAFTSNDMNDLLSLGANCAIGLDYRVKNIGTGISYGEFTSPMYPSTEICYSVSTGSDLVDLHVNGFTE